MWHASIAAHRIRIPDTVLKRYAYQALAKVGDAPAGQWEETTDRAVHVRRRLSCRDLSQLPAQHRTLVDVRTWTSEQLTDLIKPVMEDEPDPRFRALFEQMAIEELTA